MDGYESDFEDVLEMARALLGTGEEPADLWEANDLVSRGLHLRPTDAEAWLLKSQVLSALGDDTAALAAIEMALRRAPGNPEVHYWRAAVLSDLGRSADALRSIDRAFRCIGEDHRGLLEDLYCEKAMILSAAGRPLEAEGVFEAGLERCPDSALLRAVLEPLRRDSVRARLKVIPGGLR